MMDRGTIKVLIEKAYEARQSNDVESIVGAFHSDGKFELVGSKAHSAVVGAAKGHQEIRTTLANLIANFEFIQRDIVCFLIDGERAAVHSRVKLRYIPKDAIVTTDLVDLWTLQDGKVLELVEFADTALVNVLMD